MTTGLMTANTREVILHVLPSMMGSASVFHSPNLRKELSCPFRHQFWEGEFGMQESDDFDRS